jgi:hypothetical protein
MQVIENRMCTQAIKVGWARFQNPFNFRLNSWTCAFGTRLWVEGLMMKDVPEKLISHQ